MLDKHCVCARGQFVRLSSAPWQQLQLQLSFYSINKQMNEAVEQTFLWPSDVTLVNYVRRDFLWLSSVHLCLVSVSFVLSAGWLLDPWEVFPLSIFFFFLETWHICEKLIEFIASSRFSLSVSQVLIIFNPSSQHLPQSDLFKRHNFDMHLSLFLFCLSPDLQTFVSVLLSVL